MMNTICILQNPIQEYSWGSHTAIPELLGNPAPSDMPQAELWMGAHPKASSMTEHDGRLTSLNVQIKTYPEEILGKAVAEKFGSRLPYLFKILAAAKPLSIQAHPSRFQAEQGFEKENQQDIPLNAPHRNYKDNNHKPECICALTPLWGLNGFRQISDILMLTAQACPRGLGKIRDTLEKNPDSRGLKDFFNTLMNLSSDQKAKIVEDAVTHARQFSKANPIFQWLLRLYGEYPSDIGVLSPLFLNLICLEPGQAMFLPAGELHAYLDGVGVEIMANSDNVLRGGLTSKYIDVPELLQVLNFESRPPDILLPRKISDYENVYDTPAEEFILSVIQVNKQMTDAIFFPKAVEILFCTNGAAVITDHLSEIEMCSGTSVLIPAAVETCQIRGNATFYKASVPIG